MAVELVTSKYSNDLLTMIREYQGLAADTKPTLVDMANESTFLELDTGKGFGYSRTNTNPVTSNGWWGIV